MAIQMISDLPVFQITKDTPRHNILGSYMEISYLQTDANSGDSQTSYKSMAIPIGTLYKAMTSSSDSSEGGIFYFPGQCVMTDGLEISGDISVNVGSLQNTRNLAMKMARMSLSSTENVITTKSHTLNVENSLTIKDSTNTNIANYSGDKLSFGKNVHFEGNATCETPQVQSEKTIVNMKILEEQLEKTSGNMGLLFETRQLDYSDDSLSSSGWVRLNADAWLLSSDFPKTYNHLINDHSNGGESAVDEYGTNRVSYKRAKDGHKIIMIDAGNQNSENERNAERTNVLNQTGCFWYYTINVQEKKFRLPIASVFFQMNGKTDENPTVGNFVKPSLPVPPSHQHTTQVPKVQDSQKKYKQDDDGDILKVFSGTENKKTTTDTEWQSDDPIYTRNSNVVQPPAVLVETYMRCS